MLVDASAHNLAEVNGDRAVQGSLLAIYSNDPAYSNSHQSLRAFQPVPRISSLRIADNISDSIKLQRKERKITQLLLQTRIQATIVVALQPLPFEVTRYQLLGVSEARLTSCQTASTSTLRNQPTETRQKLNEALKNPVTEEQIKNLLARRLVVEQSR